MIYSDCSYNIETVHSYICITVSVCICHKLKSKITGWEKKEVLLIPFLNNNNIIELHRSTKSTFGVNKYIQKCSSIVAGPKLEKNLWSGLTQRWRTTQWKGWMGGKTKHILRWTTWNINSFNTKDQEAVDKLN